jgi:ComF family protein
MRKRGYNQSLELCRWLGKALSLPFEHTLATGTRKTANQKLLTLAERKRNLLNAFVLSAQASARIAGKSIALVDDVITTATTVSVLSRLLLDAGAAEVHVWALARTERH